jgi:hypothetical protein
MAAGDGSTTSARRGGGRSRDIAVSGSASHGASKRCSNMGNPPPAADLYLRELSTRLPGPRRARKRLLAEIRDHLDDAIAAGISADMAPADAERAAVENLGPAIALTHAWEAHCSPLRAKRRGRTAMLVGALAIASALGVAQHADGRRDPTPTHACPTSQITPARPMLNHDAIRPSTASEPKVDAVRRPPRTLAHAGGIRLLLNRKAGGNLWHEGLQHRRAQGDVAPRIGWVRSLCEHRFIV